MNSDQLVRRVFLGLTAAFVAFVVAASWTTGSEIGSGPTEFQGISGLSDLFRAHNLRDIATNVLLYVPLGIFLALALRRPRFVSPFLLIGFAVSLTMEVGQMFIGRHPSAIDLVTNSFGFVVGYWIVTVATKSYGLDAKTLLGISGSEEHDNQAQTVAALRFIYISIYSLVALLPFDVSVSLTEVYAQLFPGSGGAPKIILDPFYSLSHWQERGMKLTLELLGLVPVAVLTAFLAAARRKLNLFTPLLATVLLAVLCESAQVFLLSRTTDIVMVPIAALAGLVGWGLVRVWFILQDIDTAGARSGEARWKPLAAALAGYAAVLLILAWWPFNFETDPVAVAKKILYESNLVPFKEHFSTRSLGSAVDIVKEFGLFIPFGVLVASCVIEFRPTMPRGRMLLVSALVSAAFATFTELSQAGSIGRYIDITDILLAGAGGMSGAVLLRLFRVSFGREKS